MAIIEETLIQLKKLQFRARFHLSEKDKKYINKKGMAEIRRHAAAFVTNRLAPTFIANDGK